MACCSAGRLSARFPLIPSSAYVWASASPWSPAYASTFGPAPRSANKGTGPSSAGKHSSPADTATPPPATKDNARDERGQQPGSKNTDKAGSRNNAHGDNADADNVAQTDIDTQDDDTSDRGTTDSGTTDDDTGSDDTDLGNPAGASHPGSTWTSNS